MIPNPIRKVLSSIEARRVQALLMGGQACILYGAAEFSRDLAVLASPANLSRLKQALDDLAAAVIAVPPFEAKYLRRGHAVHCREVAERWPAECDRLKRRRPLLRLARPGRESRLTEALAAEERRERQADARYWKPLKSEIEALRLERVRRASADAR